MVNQSSQTTVLITGVTGLLGTQLLLQLPKHLKVFGLVHRYRQVLDLDSVEYVDGDITDFPSLQQTLKSIRPDLVIHTAADTKVDYCESHPDEAMKKNYESTAHIVDELNKYGGKILFCSTNMVFDGLSAPYTEKSATNPHTVYGKSKVLAEKYILEHAKHFTIFRLMTMHGWNWQPERKNMVSMAIEKLRNGQELWMTNDVYNNMLSVQLAAKTFWQAIIQNQANREIIELAGADCLNRYETTMSVCDVFGLEKKLVHEVSSDYFKGQEVARCPNTCFNTEKAQTMIDFKSQPLKSGLKQMMKSETKYPAKTI